MRSNRQSRWEPGGRAAIRLLPTVYLMGVVIPNGTSPAHVAGCYPGLIDSLVVDEADADALDGLGVRAIVTRTLMTGADARRRLAETALGVVPA